jgi:hypothetical protein
MAYRCLRQGNLTGFNTVGIDFDGVILPHGGKIYDENCLNQPDETMVKYMKWLKRNNFNILIYTSRCLFPGGYAKTKQFLVEWGLPYDHITAIKLPCILFWDDHAQYYGADNEHFHPKMEILETKTERAKDNCLRRRKKQYGY